MQDHTNESFGWDDEVETADGSGFQLLDEGPCMFKVTEFKRGRHEASARMPACYQAELRLEVTDPSGHVSDVGCNLPLTRRMAWKLTSFFKATRLIPPDTPSGSPVRYPWDEVLGTRGMCEIEHYEWTGDDNQVRTGNSVKSFLFGWRSDEAARAFPAQAEGQAGQRQQFQPTLPSQNRQPMTQPPYGGAF